VVDDHLVTAQNKYSTLVAIQTFILLCNRWSQANHSHSLI
jgi:hypothetical protein